MRKLLIGLGAVTLFIVAASCVGIGVLAYKGRGLDAESKAYVDSAVPAIVATWNQQQLLDRATPELRAAAKPEALRSLFDRFSRLGPLVAYEGAKGEANMSYMSGNGGIVSARYVAQAKFRDGAATMRVELLKRDGTWRINAFYVDPPRTDAASRSL